MFVRLMLEIIILARAQWTTLLCYLNKLIIWVVKVDNIILHIPIHIIQHHKIIQTLGGKINSKANLQHHQMYHPGFILRKKKSNLENLVKTLAKVTNDFMGENKANSRINNLLSKIWSGYRRASQHGRKIKLKRVCLAVLKLI